LCGSRDRSSSIGLRWCLIRHGSNRRSVTRNRVVRHGRRRERGGGSSRLNDRLDGFGRNEPHEEKSLEHSVGQLRRLLEEFGGALRFATGKCLHLGENIKELRRREGFERS
jgi:hypothetical protein